jgi:hypothetical protein
MGAAVEDAKCFLDMARTYALVVFGLVALPGGCATTREVAPPAETAALERALDQWTSAWSSGDVAKLLPLFTDDVYDEDVTFGAIIKGKGGLRDFAKDLAGRPATNKPFEVRGSTVVEFRDGKITRNSDSWDLATYAKQVDLPR